MATALGVPQRVHFAGVESSRLPAYFAASDAFVMPSTFETYCMAVHEAMAAGLPVIVTRSMGVASLVEHAQAGAVLRDAGDDAGFDRAVEDLRNGRTRAAAANRARTASIALSWDSVALRFAAAYTAASESQRSRSQWPGQVEMDQRCGAEDRH